MGEWTKADIEFLRRVEAASGLGGRPMHSDQRGVPTRQQTRLTEAGFIELREGNRHFLTRVGVELLKTQEVES